MKVIDTVRRTIRQHDLAGARMRVVVAVSGGADSVALVHLLRELDAAGELVVAGLAHFNHLLREDASRDEAFCMALATACGIPILVEREAIRTRAEAAGQSIEHAASMARHEFFGRALTHFAAERVAVGHTRDDQAETFLLRLLRGAGPKGLAAMHPRNGEVIRPLLRCRRADLAEISTSAALPTSKTRRMPMSASHATASGPSCSRCWRVDSTRTLLTSSPIRPSSPGTNGSGWNRSSPFGTLNQEPLNLEPWNLEPCSLERRNLKRYRSTSLRSSVLPSRSVVSLSGKR